MSSEPVNDNAEVCGHLIGVGVGPGDPALITQMAISAISAADRVVAPTTSPDEPGRAESIAASAIGDLECTRVVFDMTPDFVDGGVQARLRSHLAAARQIQPFLDANETVAFITLGDPNIYSTFPALLDALESLGTRPKVTTVPGITAFQYLASRSSTVLLDGSDSLSLITALDGVKSFQEALDASDNTIVVYKGGRNIGEITALLEEHDRLEGAVIGELMGLDGERVSKLSDYHCSEASYLVTVIVPSRAEVTS